TLTGARVPCGPLNDIADAIALAERLGLTPVVTIDDPRRDTAIRQVANPIRMSGTPVTYRCAPPHLDEHDPLADAV
ncbi:CoA transferase, partial [Streptomyces sp. SID10244]|nr:CoA transferase [Streptomyces sp. SID10244]